MNIPVMNGWGVNACIRHADDTRAQIYPAAKEHFATPHFTVHTSHTHHLFMIGIPQFIVILLLLVLLPHVTTSFSFTNTNNNMPPNQAPPLVDDALPSSSVEEQGNTIHVAILGCGMMGQEHISYISGYPNLRIDFLCDPHEPSLAKSCKVLQQFRPTSPDTDHLPLLLPILLQHEQDLLNCVHQIDLLVIASPNYLHTASLIKWAKHDINILVEKPIAVSQEQLEILDNLGVDKKARIWVAMEYRYIPAIAKLLQLLPAIGDLKMITIRENRYPFLTKIGDWNRDTTKTGDTLVEKCCHFWDLFRLITGNEIDTSKIHSVVQRGLNYQDEVNQREVPIIDAAYVTVPFLANESNNKQKTQTIGCLELCMYAEGSRHQEEIIVTGTKVSSVCVCVFVVHVAGRYMIKTRYSLCFYYIRFKQGRLEAYLPENSVYFFQRPNHSDWPDRSEPPPPRAPTIYDCSNLQDVHDTIKCLPATHGGYHYSSTSIEWYYLLQAMQSYQETGEWEPHVSLEDGVRAVEAGLSATLAIVNEEQ